MRLYSASHVFRCSLVTTIINEKNRALNLIYLKFSSYTQDCPFSDIFGKVSTALIEKYTPDEIAKMPLNELIDFIVANGNNKLKNPEELAILVQKSARKAYRLNSNMSDSVDLSLFMTLKNIRFLESQLSKLDKEISRQLKGFNQTITTIPEIFLLKLAIAVFPEDYL